MLTIGLGVGVVAKLAMPGRDGGGIVAAMLLGVVGSLAAGLIGHAFGWYRGELTGAGFAASVAGAMLLLLAYRLVGGSRRNSAWRS
jgi:uncharacterized membrane protein YeaQ/YmgE (transglycosylase-associated protein family)